MIDEDAGQEPDGMDSAIEALLAHLTKLPPWMRAAIEKELRDLLELVRGARPARIVVVGRRGAGKSTLVNAIFSAQVAAVGAVRAQTGRPSWHRHERGPHALDILDTRGFQEGSAPAEADDAPDATAGILPVLKEQCPDVLLVLAKASEVDAAMGADLDQVERIVRYVRERHSLELPVIGVVTRCDDFDPADVRRLPTEDAEKNRNVDEAVTTLSEHLKARPTLVHARLMPTVAWVGWRPDGAVAPERDYRWNIDALVLLIGQVLPTQASLSFARLAQVRELQRRIADKIVLAATAAAGGIGAQPIPLADLPILVSIQTAMVMGVAHVAGREVSKKLAAEFVGALGINAGLGFAFRQLFRAAVKFVPGAGNAISGAVAAAGTRAIGHASIAYFIDRETDEKVKETFEGAAVAEAAEPDPAEVT